MNIIEQFGSYENAKAKLKDKYWKRDNLHGSSEFTWHIKQHIQLLEEILLQYRRENNIFEIGDLVIIANSNSLDAIHRIERIKNLTPLLKDSETTYFLDNSLGCWLFQIKHATKEEIEAGYRI